MKKNLILALMIVSTLGFSQVLSDKENIFAFDLLSKTYTTDSNSFFSPYSISTVMAMVYNGAKGDTKNEIKKIFHFNSDINKNNNCFGKANKIYKSYKQNKDFKLNLANALWINNSLKLKSKFKKNVKKYFGASLYHEISADKINTWADKNTNHMIKEIVDKNDVVSAKLILTNALYFYGTWVNKFDTTKTQERNFTTATKDVIKVKMMSQTVKIPYYENRELKMVSLPYEGNKTEMIMILPQNDYDIAKVMERLNLQKFNEYVKMLQVRKTKLIIPKFKIETSYELSDILKEMGMKLSFTPDANFSLISKDKLYIDEILHKAVLDISEKGTEAAAVSAVVMRTTSVNRTNFVVNHPFLIFIKDKKTGNILFAGSIVNPNENN